VTESDDRTLVREIAERIVAAVASDEIEMFPALADVYEANPEVLVLRRGGRDESLGFGIGEAGELLTPVAFFVAGSVVEHLTNKFVDGVIEHGRSRLARLFRRGRKQGPGRAGTTVAFELTADQADEIQRVALEKAREAGLSEILAGVVADTVISALHPKG